MATATHGALLRPLPSTPRCWGSAALTFGSPAWPRREGQTSKRNSRPAARGFFQRLLGGKNCMVHVRPCGGGGEFPSPGEGNGVFGCSAWPRGVRNANPGPFGATEVASESGNRADVRPGAMAPPTLASVAPKQ